ncbi:unknown [Firmicutes bacterium CAG:555]|nr:unknown [Firmicutes bacterium CAG:555]
MVGDVLAHGQDHGLILVVACKAQCAQVGQTVDVVDVALQVQLHLKSGVPLFKGEHRLPICPEVRCVELVVEHIVDLLILKGLVGRHEQLQKLGGGAGGEAVLSVGVRILTLLFGDTAQGEVRVLLIEVVVFREHGLAGIYDGGDGLEQIPHTLKVVIHLTAAAHYEALCRIINAVARAACKGKMLKQSDVLAGHLSVTDEEAGRRKTCKAGAYYVCRFLVDTFGLFRGSKSFVVAAAVIHCGSS